MCIRDRHTPVHGSAGRQKFTEILIGQFRHALSIDLGDLSQRGYAPGYEKMLRSFAVLPLQNICSQIGQHSTHTVTVKKERVVRVPGDLTDLLRDVGSGFFQRSVGLHVFFKPAAFQLHWVDVHPGRQLPVPVCKKRSASTGVVKTEQRCPLAGTYFCMFKTIWSYIVDVYKRQIR